jgi:hypothetical protein
VTMASHSRLSQMGGWGDHCGATWSSARGGCFRRRSDDVLSFEDEPLRRDALHDLPDVLHDLLEQGPRLGKLLSEEGVLPLQVHARGVGSLGCDLEPLGDDE